jgi:hypothetical protein
MPRVQNKESILKSVREKCQLAYKGNPSELNQTSQQKPLKQGMIKFQALRINNSQPRLPRIYPPKLSLKSLER